MSLFPNPLKAIARGFLALFHIGIWSPSTIHGHLNLFSSPSTLPLVPSPPHTLCLFYCVLILSWHSEGCLNVCPFRLCFTLDCSIPLNILPYPFTSHLIFQHISVHILISSTFTSCGMRYYCCSIILFTFLFFPKFHRVVTLLQTCSTTEFIYDHGWFCVCLSLDLSSTYERKHASFVFLILTNFT
jgi:hypothetical protein